MVLKMKAIVTVVFMCCLFLDLHEGATHWEIQNFNVPQSHIPYFMGSKNNKQGFCKSGACQDGNSKLCWGYEEDCDSESQFSRPHCIHHQRPWARTLEDQVQLFWEQGDFGYIKKMKDQVMELCQPKKLVHPI